MLTKLQNISPAYGAAEWRETTTQEITSVDMTQAEYLDLGEAGAGAPDHAAKLPPGNWEWIIAFGGVVEFGNVTNDIEPDTYFDYGDEIVGMDPLGNVFVARKSEHTIDESRGLDITPDPPGFSVKKGVATRKP